MLVGATGLNGSFDAIEVGWLAPCASDHDRPKNGRWFLSEVEPHEVSPSATASRPPLLLLHSNRAGPSMGSIAVLVLVGIERRSTFLLAVAFDCRWGHGGLPCFHVPSSVVSLQWRC